MYQVMENGQLPNAEKETKFLLEIAGPIKKENPIPQGKCTSASN